MGKDEPGVALERLLQPLEVAVHLAGERAKNLIEVPSLVRT